ncbi:MAG: type secretion system protein GspH [Pseudomonadota bacterium]|jgi:general secretion pathway protein H
MDGFSLVEMMVVLFVMGLLAGVAVMTMPGDERTLRTDAERMAARTIAARDDAIVAAVPVALVVGSAGYYFEQRTDGQWRPLPGFDLTGWARGTQASVGQGRSRIVFDSLGLASSEATVRLARGTAHAVVRIGRDGQVRLDAQ